MENVGLNFLHNALYISSFYLSSWTHSLPCLVSRLQITHMALCLSGNTCYNKLSVCLSTHQTVFLPDPRSAKSSASRNTHTHTFLLFSNPRPLSCYKVRGWLNWDAVYQSYCSLFFPIQSCRKPPHISLHFLSLFSPFVPVSKAPVMLEMNS